MPVLEPDSYADEQDTKKGITQERHDPNPDDDPVEECPEAMDAYAVGI